MICEQVLGTLFSSGCATTAAGRRSAPKAALVQGVPFDEVRGEGGLTVLSRWGRLIYQDIRVSSAPKTRETQYQRSGNEEEGGKLGVRWQGQPERLINR